MYAYIVCRMEFEMNNDTTPPGKSKATIILPQVKKPNLAELRTGSKSFGSAKPQHNIKNSIRRAGPRGG